jgi:WD40 repeat protein
VHRDVKPANILLEKPAGRVKITDFGLARNLEVGTEKLTQTGAIVGTPLYMSPEQILTPQRIDALSDLYNLGVVLYELLTGETPFRGLTRLVLQQTVHEEPRPPRRLNDTIPRDLETVCLKCLRKEPARRYASARDLADDLGRFLAGEPIRARPVSRWERVAYWARRRPAAAMLAVVSVFALAAAGAGVAGLLYSSHLKGLNDNLDAQRVKAEGAQAEAETARAEARKAQAEAEQERDLKEHYLYDADMNLATRAWQEGRFGRALELLEAHRPTPLRPRDLRGFEWYYLLRFCLDARFTVRGDSRAGVPGGDLPSVAFSPDGKRLISGGKVWDVATQKEVPAQPHDRDVKVRCEAVSPDGSRLARYTEKGMQVWDLRLGKKPPPLEARARGLGSVVFSPDGKRLVSVGGQGGPRGPVVVKVWDAETGNELQTVKGQVRAGFAGSFSTDGRRFAVSSLSPENTVEVWDLTGGEKPVYRTLQKHTQVILGLAFSPDGRRLVSVAGRSERVIPSSNKRPGELEVWDAATGKVLFSRQDPDGLRCVAFSHDGKRLAAGGQGGVVRVWDVAREKEILALPGHTREVTGVAFAPDGKRLASVALDNTVQVWNIPAVEPLRLEQESNVWCLAFSPDGRRLATGSLYGIHLWDLAAGDEHREDFQNIRGPGKCRRLAFSPDGTRLAAGHRVWDSATGREIAALKAKAGHRPRWGGEGVAFSPDGKRVASAWLDHISIWDAQTGEEIVALNEPRNRRLSGSDALAFDPDGRLLACGYRSGVVKVCDAATGREVWAYTPAHAPGDNSGTMNPAGVQQVAFSPNGKRLAAALGSSQDARDPGEVKIWDAASGREVFTLKGHTKAVWSVAFSPGGTRLVTCSCIPSGNGSGEGGEIKIWDALTGQELLTLRCEQCIGVTFSPDGRRLACAGWNNVVTIWGAPPEGEGPRPPGR